MKIIVSFFSLSLLVFFSCDKIKFPNEKAGTVVGSKFITKTNADVSNFKKVLLEDYTGHKCGNCPPAAVTAENLLAIYSNSLIVVAVHAGFYAKTQSPDYLVSYTTTAGNDWDGATGFGVSVGPGNPNGMVNRKNYQGYGQIQRESKWSTTIPIALADPFMVKLDLTTNYDTTARALNTDVKATFKSGYANNTKLSLLIIENGLIGSQTDYTKNPDLIPDYRFEHVLRGAINGSWGESLKKAPILANDTVKISNVGFPIDSKFNDKSIYLIAFVYDELTKEVLQVEKLKIR